MGAGGKIAAIFILSLFLTSFLIAYFDTGLNGSTKVNVIDLPISINGLTLIDSFSNSVDCLNNVKHYDIIGGFSCVSDGLILNTGTLRNVHKLDTDKEGSFTNSYSIKYINGTTYYIIIAEQATPIPTQIFLQVAPDGLSIPKSYLGLVISGDYWFTPLQDANLQDADIQTIYDGKTNSLSFSFNGAVYNISSDNLPPLYGSQLNYYEGITTIGGYELTSISSDYLPPAGSALNGLSIIIDLAWTMLKLATYTFPYEIIPLQFQILLILPQEFLIVIGVAMFIREG